VSGAESVRSIEDLAHLTDDSGLRQVLEDFPDMPWDPLLSEDQEEAVLRLEEELRDIPPTTEFGETADTRVPPKRSLRHFWVLDPRGVYESDVVLRAASLLAATDSIGSVYPERYLTLPFVDASGEPEYTVGDQGWVSGDHAGDVPLQSGVHADSPAVWPLFDGAGIGFFDIERGWYFEHEELEKVAAIDAVADPYIDLVAGASSDSKGAINHGTMSLGVVLAQVNDVGIAGLAPGCDFKGVATIGEPEAPDLIGAMLEAIDRTDAGDVILIEVETVRRISGKVDKECEAPAAGDMLGGLPVEVDEHHFLAIWYAVALGRVVIEPAGNGDDCLLDGEWDLDAFEKEWEADWAMSLDRGSSDFLDSGAIMVSACDRELVAVGQHRRASWANFGSRVDCYAWGEFVRTAAAISPNLDLGSYYGWYGGTSSASAIVAGCAVLVQQMHLAATGSRALPGTIRQLLSDPNLGTAVVDEADAVVGSMPDLGLIAPMVLPDLYVRDSVDDDGSTPQASVFQSPDILLRAAPLTPDEVVDLSEGGSLAEALVPNSKVTVGEANFLYLRVANRGVEAAVGGAATLYWSEAASLVVPEDWKPIADVGGATRIDLPDIDPGTGPVLAGPLVWQPGPGEAPDTHGCFIAVLDHPRDQAPPLFPTDPALPPANFDTFLSFVGSSNNVAWRNFSVVNPPVAGQATTDGVPGADDVTPAWEATERFEMRGEHEQARVFDFRLENELASPALVTIEVPEEVERDAVEAGSSLPAGGSAGTGVRALVVPAGETAFSLRLEPRTRYPCTLRIQVPAGADEVEGRIAIVQSHERREVGRFTWHVAGTDA
jgi:hypothetical protein